METVTVNQEYRMTIHVDAEYLTDGKTVYPIRIDPTIEVNSSDGTRAIEDVTLNSTAVSAPASTSLYIGNRQNYGKTRILMKFPGLDLSDVTQSSAITSATVEIRDLMCESESMSISVHTFTGNTWSETDSDWSSPADWSKVSPNSYETTAMDTKSVSYSKGVALTTPHRYAFNIKPAVQGWVSGDYNQNKGIIFKSNGIEGTTTYQKKTFSSFNRSSYQPSIKVTYQNPTTPEEPEEPEEPQNPSADSIIGKESSSLLVGSTEDLLTEASVTATWTSSDPSVATVSYGIVTAIKPGTTTICATLDTGESDSCEITVCGASIYSLMQGKKFYLYNEDTENTLTVSLSNLGICDYITGMNDQMWTLTEVSAEYNLYHIATELSSRANAPYLTESQLLNVSCGPTSDSAVWYFKSAGDGRYYIVCASSGRYLTASTDKGTNAYLSEENSSTVQKWEMIVKFEEGEHYRHLSEKDGFEKYKYPVEMYYVVGTSVEKYEKEFSNRWLVLIQEAVARWNKQDIIIHLALSEEEYADLKDKNSKIIIHHLKLCKDGDPTKLGYNNALGTGTGADRQISIFMEHIEDLANEAFPASDEYDETTREAYINHVFLFTVLHELGHSFGLDDVGYDFGTYPSIMKSKKNEWNYYNDVYGKAVPQLVDFVGAHHQQIQNQSS